MEFERRVDSFDESSLFFAAKARAENSGPLVLLTPAGGMERCFRTPMNLARFDEDGAIAWALPVDMRRLQVSKPDSMTRALFQSGWAQLLKAVTTGTGGGVLWEPSTPVGRPPPDAPYWTEYQRVRPWAELAKLAGGNRLLVACSAAQNRRNGSRLQYHVPAWHVHPTASAAIVQAVDIALELAHFAVLSPTAEPGWRVGGVIDAPSVSSARAAFARLPQRRRDGLIL